MRKKNYISHQTSTNHWLNSKVSLAKTSRMAYRGEVQRMSEYLEKIGIYATSEISRDEWWNYLTSLNNKRESVLTKRCEDLKTGSIHQARRITRDFLMWALDKEIINWLPRLPPIDFKNNINQTKQINHNKFLDKNLIKILLGNVTPKGIKDNRTYLMMNLIFWGALKPTELIQLTISDLTKSNIVSIFSRSQNRTIYLPAHIGRIWDKYIQSRNNLSEKLAKPSDPLISQLGQNERLSAWSIWSAFQEWHQKHGDENSEIITPRELRKIYLKLLCEDGESKLEIACAMVGVNERTVVASKQEIANDSVTLMQNQVFNQLNSHFIN